MKKSALIFLALTGSNAAFGADQICHIANAGFYVEKNETGVFFDALTHRDDYNGRFHLPTPLTLANMQHNKANFANAKLALVTHQHGDHFDAKQTLQHIRQTAIRYIMPAPALALLQAEGLTEEEAKRVDSFDAETLIVKQTVSGKGYQVEVYDIDHGEGQPTNLGYRLTIAGTSFFHPGDIVANETQLLDSGLDSTEVDYMMMPFWYLLEQRATLDKAWKIKYLIPTHFHAGEQAWMQQFGGRDSLIAHSNKQWDNTIKLTEEMACQPIK